MFGFTHVDEIQATNSSPPRELFRFGQGFLNLRSDLVIASPLYDNPTLLLLTKQSETRHISPSQPLDALSGWMLRLYDVLYCLNQEDTKISLLVLRRSRNCRTTRQRTHKPWQGMSRSPH